MNVDEVNVNLGPSSPSCAEDEDDDDDDIGKGLDRQQRSYTPMIN